MSDFLRAARFGLLLIAAIAVLIILPAFLFGLASQWQIIFLAGSYFIFFLSTIWRAIKYGGFAKRSEDEQTKSLSGRLASILAIVGIGGSHWLAVYDFSKAQNLENSAINLGANLLAIFLIITAISVNRIAVQTLGRFFDSLTIKPEHRLVTDGIYARVRHPIYLSYILLFAGYCLLLHDLLGIISIGVVCAIWFGNRISIEEKMLEKEFAEEYEIYKQHTKRLFPFVY